MLLSRLLLFGLYSRLLRPSASRPIEDFDPRIEATSCTGPVGGTCLLRCVYRGPDRVLYGQWLKEMARRTLSGNAALTQTGLRRSRRTSLASFWNLHGRLEADSYIRVGRNRSIWGNATWTADERFDLRLYITDVVWSDEGTYLCAFYLDDLDIATAKVRVVVPRLSFTGPPLPAVRPVEPKETRRYPTSAQEPSWDLFFLAPLISIAFCLFARRYILPRLTGMNGWVRMV